MAVHLARGEEPSERVFYVSDDCFGPFRSAVERDPLTSGRIVQVETLDLGRLESLATAAASGR